MQQSESSKLKLSYDKLQKKLRRQVGQAIQDFSMIQNGDRVMVCLSGGKDSYTLLYILQNLQKSAPIQFDLVAVNLDQKQPGFPETILSDYLNNLGVEYKIVQEDTYSIVKRLIPEGKTTCSLCSRLRRGILYKTAEELKCNKIALGHHRDDAVETFFLNMFFAGKLKTMPAKLISDNNKHIVIRPLIYAREKDIQKFSDLKEFPIIPCNLCGSQPNLQRGIVKEMLQCWDKKHPGRIETIFTALQNVSTSHLLDKNLYDYANLESRKIQSIDNQDLEKNIQNTNNNSQKIDLDNLDLDRLVEEELFPMPDLTPKSILSLQDDILIKVL